MSKIDSHLINLKSLLNGVDPFSGNKLVENSDFKNQKIQDLLFNVVSDLECLKSYVDANLISKNELKEKRNLADHRPQRSGLPWSDRELSWLTKQIKSANKNLTAISSRLMRSETAIAAKLVNNNIVVGYSDILNFSMAPETKEWIEQKI